MAAAALVRSFASKMLSRAAAAPTHHHRSLIVCGLHGGASSGLVADVIQQGTADALVSSGMAAATGRLTTKVKMAHAPPHPYHLHRLVHSRGIHSRTSPDPIPSTPPKVLDTTSTSALDNARTGVACFALFCAATYLHFWVNPGLAETTAMLKDLSKKSSHLIDSKNMEAFSVSHQTPTTPASAGHGNTTDKGTGVIDKLGMEAAVKMMHSHENRIKALEARILKAENAELKIALDSAPSQGKA